MSQNRPVLFRGRHFEDVIIILCVRWYLRYSLSYRDLEEIMVERGLSVDHVTIWRWVQRYAPLLNQRLRREIRHPNRSWRVDETYVRVAGNWTYLYRAVDSAGDTIDFMLSPQRDLAAAKLFLHLALSATDGIRPRVINVDGHPAYARAIAELKRSGDLGRRCRCRPSPYLNNIIEQDHRFIKSASRRVLASDRRKGRGGRSTVTRQCMPSAKGRSAGWPRATWWVSANSSTSCSASLLDSRLPPPSSALILLFATLFSSLLAAVRGPFQGTWVCPNGITATPAIEQGTHTLYIISADGRLFGLDLATGAGIDIAPSDCVNYAMSRFNTRNLDRLGNQVRVTMKADEDGYFGRECPIQECVGYFKVTPGTGIQGPAPCHCPYCGHSGANNTFWTQEQLDYAESVALRQFTDALHSDLKSMEFEHRPRGSFGVGISLKFKPGAPVPIRYYREKALETEVVCDHCTLRYTIYGVFGWCPDCGVHNSLQILRKNLELARKQLVLAESVEKELAAHLLGDALENVVSAFDGFGREACAAKGIDIQFQNLASARRRVQDSFQVDFADALMAGEWDSVTRVFQKRHLLAHKMGVVDEDYLRKANDPGAIIGRKLTMSSEEVTAAIGIVERLGKRLFDAIL